MTNLEAARLIVALIAELRGHGYPVDKYEEAVAIACAALSVYKEEN